MALEGRNFVMTAPAALISCIYMPRRVAIGLQVVQGLVDMAVLAWSQQDAIGQGQEVIANPDACRCLHDLDRKSFLAPDSLERWIGLGRLLVSCGIVQKVRDQDGLE